MVVKFQFMLSFIFNFSNDLRIIKIYQFPTPQKKKHYEK